MNLHDAALAYAARDWPVFPLQRGGKLPLFPSAHPEGDQTKGTCRGECGRVGHGFHDATIDPERISEWWGAKPDANIGIACGPAGLFVLDVDGPDGEASIVSLQERHGRLPETLWQRTGRGWQAIFTNTMKIGNTAHKLGPGLDTRSIGGYIVAAPSIHPNGAAYAWWNEGAPLAAIPAWIRRLLTRKPRTATPLPSKPVSDRYVAAALEREASIVATSRQGARNATLNTATFSLARLIGQHLSEEQLYVAMHNAGTACGLSAHETDRTIRSAIDARRGRKASAS